MNEKPDPALEASAGLGVCELVRALPPLPSASDASLRDRLVELERARNIIEAEQAQTMTELHQRAVAADAARDAAITSQARALIPAHEARLVEFVADEIAVLLASTRMLAAHRLDAALDISAHEPVTEAWAIGSIDARKAAVIASGLREVDPTFTPVLAAEASQYATTHTAPQTRSWLARRVITADPGAAEIRRTGASEGRRVVLTPLADGMAELSAVLPGTQARQAYDTLHALAHSAKDGRTMDQRRADALMDLLTGRADPPSVTIQVVVPADTLAGDADLPGVVSGLGPITGPEARRLAEGPGQTIYRTLTIDPDTGAMLNPASGNPPSVSDAAVSGSGPTVTVPAVEPQYRPSRVLDRAVRARDLTCRFPGCRRSAIASISGTDLDHTIPWPAGSTSWANLAVLCRHHHRLKHSAGWHTALDPDGTMRWTTPTGHVAATHPWHYVDPPDTS
ncbi:MAG: DUF222 domain-containing protein [Actinomycetes bacterium]